MGKFYAVKKGRQPGIYLTWDECKAQVDGFPGPVFKKFSTQAEAQAFCDGAVQPAVHPLPAGESAQGGRPMAELGLFAELPEVQVDRIIYTDGSCLRNPAGPGGYAAVILQGETVLRELYGSEPSTTNNRMEMMAAIRALESLAQPMRVMLYTDSRYLLNGFAKNWVAGWKRRNWVTSQGTPVLNPELWKRLDELVHEHTVIWRWLKGQRGTKYNERCDELAKRAAEKQITSDGER